MGNREGGDLGRKGADTKLLNCTSEENVSRFFFTNSTVSLVKKRLNRRSVYNNVGEI